jgi:peptidoglycan/LPS O-acetylase OafA/YrhL
MRSGPAVTESSPGGGVATRTIASALGMVAGASGLDHGFFEALQGNTATHGLFVQAIGPAQRMWLYGTEDAFTIVPNFLLTGILAMIMGTLVIVWAAGYIDRRNGGRVFLGLGALLFLSGGGVALLGFVALCWAVSRRIGATSGEATTRPVDGFRKLLAGTWPAFLAIGLTLVTFALEIAIAGFVPGVSNPDHVQLICWSSLAAMLVMLLLAIVGASADDAQRRSAADAATAVAP